MKNLRDSVVIVTGAARSLGKGYAEGLLKAGAKVAILDILKEEGQQTAEQFGQLYGTDRVAYYYADVTDGKQMEDVYEQVSSAMGKPDIFVNNAGAALPDWEKMLEINLTSLIRNSYLATEKMNKNKGGNGGILINISSVAGYRVLPGSPVYIASKFGVLGYTRALADTLDFESEGHGIKVITLCPAWARTPMVQPIAEAYDAGVVNPLTTDIRKIGGFIELEYLVTAFMSCVEDDHPNGAVIEALAKQITYLFPEELAGKPAIKSK